jgi:hypothetical protein
MVHNVTQGSAWQDSLKFSEIWILESQWFPYSRLNEENGVTLWHVDLLLGNNHEINSYTIAVAK